MSKAKNQTEQLKNLEEQYQFRISQISHEIRNPVTLINTYLQLLIEKHPEVVGFEYWNYITSNMEFLKDLLNEISTYNNSKTIHKEPVNIYSFLTHLVDELSPVLNEHEIQIKLSKESALPLLDVDPTKFKQALLNLLRNSIEAIESKGLIIIRVYFEDLSIIITIEDNGPGIPTEFLPTLFEPFVTHKKEGTGLGLAITKNVIDAHNGTIEVSSTENTGTIFTIKLPI